MNYNLTTLYRSPFAHVFMEGNKAYVETGSEATYKRRHIKLIHTVTVMNMDKAGEQEKADAYIRKVLIDKAKKAMQ